MKLLLAWGCFAVFVAAAGLADHLGSVEPRGEWRIEVRTPPCDSVHHMEVIYPKKSGSPVLIECKTVETK